MATHSFGKAQFRTRIYDDLRVADLPFIVGSYDIQQVGGTVFMLVRMHLSATKSLFGVTYGPSLREQTVLTAWSKLVDARWDFDERTRKPLAA